MSVIRVMFAVLIGFSLAIAPAAAAVASLAAPLEHCDKKDMGDCCCDKANACRADTCAAKCFKTPGYLATTLHAFDLHRQAFATPDSDKAALDSWPPPAPPPRF